MTAKTGTLADGSRQGAQANLPAGSDKIAELLALAYEAGRDSVLEARFELADDLWHIYVMPQPRRTYAQRIADRLADMEARFGPARYPGGPVDWETGIPLFGRLERVIV